MNYNFHMNFVKPKQLLIIVKWRGCRKEKELDRSNSSIPNHTKDIFHSTIGRSITIICARNIEYCTNVDPFQTFKMYPENYLIHNYKLFNKTFFPSLLTVVNISVTINYFINSLAFDAKQKKIMEKWNLGEN